MQESENTENKPSETFSEKVKKQREEELEPEKLLEQIKDLGIKLKEAEEKLKDLEDKNLRLNAEMQNTRSRSLKENATAREYAIQNFASDLTVVSEHMILATKSVGEEALANNDIAKKILDGVKITLDELTSVFSKYGVVRINPEIGESFNHELHQALTEIPSKEHKSGLVLAIIQAGYKFKDRLLRPALVGVSKKTEDEKQEDIS
ncbi:MAG: nucleotide exchange factor GrpE [Alphaproteobacteria bacterium]|jgi:molecular chaperone GrpE